jgi:hypothetical protein
LLGIYEVRFDRYDETVTAARKGLNKLRTIGGISEGFSQSIHGGVYAVIEVDESVRRPELFAEFFPSHEVARVFQQQSQDLK